MPAALPALEQLLRDTIIGIVRQDERDLTARQLGVFLTCYLRDGGHTVRGLAAEFSINKPAVTRSLDRLGELQLIRRLPDPSDRRSILVGRTAKGAAFLAQQYVNNVLLQGVARRPAKRDRHGPMAPSVSAIWKHFEFSGNYVGVSNY